MLRLTELFTMLVLLRRFRPEIHIAKIVVLPFPGKRTIVGPSLDDQFLCFTKTLTCKGWVPTIGKILLPVPDYLTRDHAPASDDIKHGYFLGNANRVVVQGKRIPDHGNLYFWSVAS